MDLSTRYLGLALRNPLVASASPLSNTLDGVRRLADAGVSAVVLFSLFEEQLRHEAERDARLTDADADADADIFAESPSYFPAGADEDAGARRYLSLLERAAAAVDIPVIGSLNGVTSSGWTSYARAMQDAGAAAIELNIYFIAGNPRMTGREVEQRHVDILRQVKAVVTVPVAVKLGPQFSSPARSRCGLTRPGRTAWSCSTGSFSPTSTRTPSPWCTVWNCPARPRPGCRAPGSPYCAGRSVPRSRRPAASRDQPMSSSTCWRAPTS